MNIRHLTIGLGIIFMLAAAPITISATPSAGEPTATLLATGLEGALGSTVGPDGALDERSAQEDNK